MRENNEINLLHVNECLTTHSLPENTEEPTLATDPYSNISQFCHEIVWTSYTLKSTSDGKENVDEANRGNTGRNKPVDDNAYHIFDRAYADDVDGGRTTGETVGDSTSSPFLTWRRFLGENLGKTCPVYNRPKSLSF